MHLIMKVLRFLTYKVNELFHFLIPQPSHNQQSLAAVSVCCMMRLDHAVYNVINRMLKEKYYALIILFTMLETRF